jgi:DNA repair protein RecO (recombination protein O)
VRIETRAIVCAVRPHGEHGAIVRALTPADGLQPGYVRGGRSRRLRPVLVPGNVVYPRLFEALDGLLAALEAAPAARGWAAALVRFELLLLAELGFGLDLAECAATGATGDLAFVSPKSGRAVSRAAAGAYADRLFRLPSFLVEGGPAAGWNDIFDGLRITGHFLARDVLIERQSEVLAARERLVDRLKRAAG